MPGNYLIIDLSQTPPALVTAEDVLPAAILEALAGIDARLETISMGMAQEQAQIDNLAQAVSSVADHVSSATAGLQLWISEHQGTVDMTGATAALASLQAADQGLSAIVPQAPVTPLPDPIPDPGPPSPDLPPPTPDPVPPVDGPPPDEPVVNPL